MTCKVQIVLLLNSFASARAYPHLVNSSLSISWIDVSNLVIHSYTRCSAWKNEVRNDRCCIKYICCEVSPLTPKYSQWFVCTNGLRLRSQLSFLESVSICLSSKKLIGTINVIIVCLIEYPMTDEKQTAIGHIVEIAAVYRKIFRIFDQLTRKIQECFLTTSSIGCSMWNSLEMILMIVQ